MGQHAFQKVHQLQENPFPKNLSFPCAEAATPLATSALVPKTVPPPACEMSQPQHLLSWDLVPLSSVWFGFLIGLMTKKALGWLCEAITQQEHL